MLKAINSKNTMLIKRIESSADFTRGMLKEELEDAGLLRRNGKSGIDVPTGALDDITNVFNPKRSQPEPEDDEDEDDLIGDDNPVPEIGKRNTHPERRAKKTLAQTMSEQFKALMEDEKESFLQMIFPEAKPVLEHLGLLANKKPTKKVKEAVA